MSPENKAAPKTHATRAANANGRLDRLTELSFEFDQAGKIVDCIGTIKDGGNVDHDYAGSGLARFVRDSTAPIKRSTRQRNDFAIPRWREACQVCCLTW
jgi:hypothetical protein